MLRTLGGLPTRIHFSEFRDTETTKQKEEHLVSIRLSIKHDVKQWAGATKDRTACGGEGVSIRLSIKLMATRLSSSSLPHERKKNDIFLRRQYKNTTVRGHNRAPKIQVFFKGVIYTSVPILSQGATVLQLM